MGICNKLAGVLAPVVLGAIILSNADELVKQLEVADAVQKNLMLDELASRVVVPYTIMAVVLAGLALMVKFSPLPELENIEDERLGEDVAAKTSVMQFPNLVLGVIALFLYVGAEVIAGDTIGTYGQAQGIPLREARNFTAFTLTAMVAGYIIGIICIPKFISQARALSLSAITGILFTVAAMVTSGYTSVLFIALLGLANALVWPAIWPLAIQGLGRFTKTGSALLIMAIAGGALLPLVYGWLADAPAVGARMAYVVLIPCYLFILFYAVKGHKMNRWVGRSK
jgi:glucose/galactose transporter